MQQSHCTSTFFPGDIRASSASAHPVSWTGVFPVERSSPGTRSVWGRQQGPNGRNWQQRAEYTIVLHNLTRFNEIGRVMAYLKSKIPTYFELEDLDTYCPQSRTSTPWKVTFQLSGCPTFLQGIVRITWFRTPKIIQHPDVGRRLQCRQCG